MIAIIDRYPVSRIGLGSFLNEHFADYPALEYETVHELNEARSAPKPLLIILGLNNSWLGTGLALLGNLRKEHPNSKIIVYDDMADRVNALKYLRHGASGYISKSEAIAGLKEGIDQVLKGKKYVTKQILEAIFEEQIFGRGKGPDHQYLLTQGEFEVVRHLIRGLTIRQISVVLQKKVSIIDTFKKRIFEKLNVKDIIELRTKMAPLRDNGS